MTDQALTQLQTRSTSRVMLLSLIATCAASWASPSFASGPTYKTVLDDKQYTVWYRNDVVERLADNASVIVMVLTKATGQANIMNIEFNCPSKRWIANSGQRIDKDGSVLYEQRVRDKTWTPVASGSGYEAVMKQVCK